MARGKKSTSSDKKTGRLENTLKLTALKASQGSNSLYLFKEKASVLWSFLSINRREEDKDVGYQRVLSNSRVAAVAGFIESGKAIPVSIIVSLDENCSYDEKNGTLSIPPGKDIGWVIDGQHRLAGAHEAAKQGTDIELCVAAFVGLDEQSQIDQFITINREAKGVPTSLVLDLLKKLPQQRPSDIAKERAVDISRLLKEDKESPFFHRIVSIGSPGANQISLVNFARKVSPLVNVEKGLLRVYTLNEQAAILNNYFKVIRDIYKDEWKKSNSIFFKTIGFGALLNVFEYVFMQTLSRYGGFTQNDIHNVLGKVAHFDFSQWQSYGSGNKAEMSAADDLLVDIKRLLESDKSDLSKTIKL